MEDISRGVRSFTVGTAVSRLMGLAREMVQAHLFGAGFATDAFNVAFRIPNMLRDLFAETALSAAFIPVLTSERAKGKEFQNRLARFFTYASTLHATMKAAAERGLRVIVLDRPNPINGLDVAGPMLKPSEQSAVNHHPLPVRHGMTMGELAELMNADEHLGVRLEVVRMPHYDRKLYFDETGLAWWPPSPNLRTVAEAVLYPGVALVEGTNVSVGRGTDTPFEVVGAPWIDGLRLAAELAGAGLSGVSFQATSFTPNVTPKANRYAGTLCQGVRLRVENRAVFEPVRTGMAIAITLRKLFRNKWDSTRLHRAVGDQQVAAAILKSRRLPEVEALFRDELAAFRAKRLKYLLYPR